MIVAQQSVSVTPGTIPANTASVVAISSYDSRFRGNLPILAVLDMADAGLHAGLVLESCRLNQTTGNLELTISNVTAAGVTDSSAHTIWLYQVE